MTSYRCPVCGINDLYAYLRCYRPDCTDGRDSSIRAEAKKLDDRINDAMIEGLRKGNSK